jgi:hypothetical protein
MRASARTLAAAGAALVGVGLALWSAPVAEAITAYPALETGWWSQQPLAQPVADKGFEVSWALEQEQSMAAVRLDVPALSGQTVYLALTESGGSAPDQGALRVCVTRDAWTAANPGAYADRPQADCSTTPSVDLGRDANAKEWVGDITSLVGQGGPISLVVRPVGKEVTAGVPASAPFSVQVSKAETRVDDTGGSSGDSDTSEPPVTFDTTGGGGSYGVPDVSYPDVGSGLATPDLAPIGGPATTVAPATADPEEQIALGPVDVTSSGGRPWGRLLVLTPISAGLGTLAAAGRRWWSERTLARRAV